MNQNLLQIYDALETERHRILKRIEEISSEQFHYAMPGKWSVSQILAHLVAAEKISRTYIEKKIPGINTMADTGIPEEIKMSLLKISQRFPFKFKAPKVVILNTPAYQTSHELKTEWASERIELKKLLERFQDKDVRKKIYNHVRVGMLNIQQALIFFREHYFHHLPQINRLLKPY